MTQEMKAGVSGSEGVTIASVSRPEPSPDQILVRVVAAGMNRADLLASKGAGVATSASLGQPVGMEWAGEITQIGRDVTGFEVGDLVACSGSGGYAEYAVCDAGRAIVLAPDTDLVQAAVLPLALMTAHNAVITSGRLKAKDRILIQGASSAVGLACLQIARLTKASVIVGTSYNAERRARLGEFGATHSFDPNVDGWAKDAMDLTEGNGFDVIVDMVSGSQFSQLMSAAAIKGRIVNVGRLGGTRGEFNFDLHAARRLDYIGVTFRTRSIQEIREVASNMRNDLWGAVKDGRLALPIDRTFALSDAAAAHAHVSANAHFGKVVLIP